MKGLCIASALFLSVNVFAQAPAKISYQAIIRDPSNQLITNTNIGIKIEILKGSTSSPSVYTETHREETNANGLVSIIIGEGTSNQDLEGRIDWADGPYFLKIEIDPSGGTNFTISSTSQIMSVPYALYATKAQSCGDSVKLGDFAFGGIVFWVDNTGKHGLVCAKEDQSSGTHWHAGTFCDTRSYGNGPNAGKGNTPLIIATHEAYGDDGSLYAARICAMHYVYDSKNSIGYNDWYLPSLFELSLMYENRTIINETAIENHGSAFTSSYYWSSTELNENAVWVLNLMTNSRINVGKASHAKVRAVRVF
ncbi:MAG: DUF1566 domain-containing protein [Bacteroidales bacterium]|nr:DUF1566 domain-containing protein [Bacteroidales bacterium]